MEIKRKRRETQICTDKRKLGLKTHIEAGQSTKGGAHEGHVRLTSVST